MYTDPSFFRNDALVLGQRTQVRALLPVCVSHSHGMCTADMHVHSHSQIATLLWQHSSLVSF